MLRHAIADLHPAHFAIVMATGVISIAAQLLGAPRVAAWLFGITIGLFVVLTALLLVRVTFFGPQVLRDLGDHVRGPGFFTLVVAACVLGQQTALIAHRTTWAAWIWGVAMVLWCVLTYGFLTAVMVAPKKPSLASGISGSWLLAVVATQALALLGALVVRPMDAWQHPFFLLTMGLHLVGCLLYVLIITLIFYRLAFFDVDPQRLSPAFWINMGAVSITTAAGATLLADLPTWPMLRDLAPFVKGVTLAFWATATWWIPLLILLGIWRHIHRRFPIRYDVQYWAMVFPLGMYAAATTRLAHTVGIPFILPLGRLFLYAAGVAWLLAMGGLLRRLYTLARHRADPSPVDAP